MKVLPTHVPNPAVPVVLEVDWQRSRVGVPAPPVVDIPLSIGVPGPAGPAGEAALPAVIDLGGPYTTTGA